MAMSDHDDEPILAISVAARLAGMHPQTLRQYDRLGLVSPRRTAGRGRRYSRRDVALLREVQHLSQVEGMNLAGIRRVLDLEREAARLRAEVERLTALIGETNRVFSASSRGEVVPRTLGQHRRRPKPIGGGALVVWRPN